MAVDSSTDQSRPTRRDRVFRRRISDEVARTKACTVLVCLLSVLIFYFISTLLPENLGSKPEFDNENTTA
ncbi:hypothetical protein V3C99_017292 [Haemonchus contortus]|uniref:OppC_N domain-containing protein n=1 Tax=Haemonchus contortus TaxID=6289 RepID=A0A7I4Z5U4_HAECO